MRRRFRGRLLDSPACRRLALRIACVVILSAVVVLSVGGGCGGFETVDPPTLQIDEGPPTPPVHSVVGDLSPVIVICGSSVTDKYCRIEEPPATKPEQPSEQPSNATSPLQSSADTEWKIDIKYGHSSDRLTYGFRFSRLSGLGLNLRPLTLSLPYTYEADDKTYTVTMPDLNPLKITLPPGSTKDAFPRVAFNTFLSEIRTGKAGPKSPDFTITTNAGGSYTFTSPGLGSLTLTQQPDGSYTGPLGGQNQQAILRNGQWRVTVGGQGVTTGGNTGKGADSGAGLGRTDANALRDIGLGRFNGIHLASRPDYGGIEEALDYLDYCDWAYYNDYEGYWYWFCDEDEEEALSFLEHQMALGWQPFFMTAMWLEDLRYEMGPHYLSNYFWASFGNWLQNYEGSTGSIPYSANLYYYFDKPGLLGGGKFASLGGASSDIWYTTTQTWFDRQADLRDSIGGPGLFASNPEFVQQYVLVTNNFGPEYGRNAGSVVNQIIPSGISASPFQAFDRAYDFGADLGGPIVKDRLWGSYGNVNTWQAQGNWNYGVGEHNIKAGVNWTYQRSRITFLPDIGALPSLNGGNWQLPDSPIGPGYQPVIVPPTTTPPVNSFGSSIGFAYSPQWGGFLTGHGKTTIRGGYRLLYDPPFYNIFINQSTAYTSVLPNNHVGAGAALMDDGTVVIVGGTGESGAAGADVFNPIATPPTASPTSYNALEGPALGFTGYQIPTTSFQYAHGYSFVSDLGVRNFSQGYLAGIVPLTSSGSLFWEPENIRARALANFDAATSGGVGGYGTPSMFSPSYNARGPWWSDPSIGGGPELSMPWLSWLNTGAGVHVSSGAGWGNTGNTALEVGALGAAGTAAILGGVAMSRSGDANVSANAAINAANAAIGTSAGTFTLKSTASVAIPAGWTVLTLQQYKEQIAASAKQSKAPSPGSSGGNPKTKAEILGPDDLVLRVDAQGRVILARGPWELATLNAAPPFGLESGTAAWMAAPLPGDLPQQISYSLVANGNSSGEAFELQVMDPSGQFKKVVLPDGVVLEPAAKKPPQAQAASQIAGQVGNMLKQQITAFCLQFAKLPPEAEMLYKIADPEKQRQYRPAAYVLEAGYELGANGELNPDIDPKEYIDAIRQYAVWAEQEGWDEQQFTEHWIERTKKNAQAMNIAWTKQIEDALRAAAPNRWRDITKVRNKAKSMMQSESSPAL